MYEGSQSELEQHGGRKHGERPSYGRAAEDALSVQELVLGLGKRRPSTSSLLQVATYASALALS